MHEQGLALGEVEVSLDSALGSDFTFLLWKARSYGGGFDGIF